MDTQWREPITVAAGDTVSFTRKLYEYPASQGWNLDYEIRGGAEPISFQSTPNGDLHVIYLAPAVTALWLPGQSYMAGYASNGTDRERIYCGELTIAPNLEGARGDLPIKTFAQRMVEKLERVMEGTADSTLLESRIGETQFKFLTPQQLTWWHGYWKGQRRQEIAKERAQNGLPTGNKIRPVARVCFSGGGLGVGQFRGTWG
jgi:hypothetical protein